MIGPFDVCPVCLGGDAIDKDQGYFVCPECDAEYNLHDLFDAADEAFDELDLEDDPT